MIEIREASRYSWDQYEKAYAAGFNWLVVDDEGILAGFRKSSDAIAFAYTLENYEE